MTKKDYVRAARIVRECAAPKWGTLAAEECTCCDAIEEAFVELFKESPLFNEEKFRAACKPDK